MEPIQFVEGSDKITTLLGINEDRAVVMKELRKNLLLNYASVSLAFHHSSLGIIGKINTDAVEIFQDVTNGFQPTTPGEAAWCGYVAMQIIKELEQLIEILDKLREIQDDRNSKKHQHRKNGEQGNDGMLSQMLKEAILGR